MKNRIYIGLFVAGIMTGCYDYDAAYESALKDSEPVSVGLSFSVSNPSPLSPSVERTRMGDSVVQLSGSYYRGLQDIHIIPFTTLSEITVTDRPGPNILKTDAAPYKKTEECFYYHPNCSFLPGTSSVLFYGRGGYSVKVNGNLISGDRKDYYGSTTAVFPASFAPSGIVFSPEQICPITVINERASALAAYLTYIVKTPGWSATEDLKLQALYQNYTGEAYKSFAGSSTNILAYIKELYEEVGKRESDAALAEAIRERIKAGATISADKVTALTQYDFTDDDTDNPVVLSGYPANIGLPDGAAAMQWIANEERFMPVTTTTTISPITSVTRYAYPAELYYYGNSLLKTSNDEVNLNYYETETSWSTLVGKLYKGSGVITGNTKATAIIDPIHYGVARLSIKLMAAPETLIDGDGNELVYGKDWNDTSFPLTAVVVGGQYPVGFDFRPETVKAKDDVPETDMRYVYDCQVKTNKSGNSYGYYYLSPSGASGNTNTLVLQTYEDDKVSVILEFENNSGKRFMGKDGVIYPGAKFYLIGSVDPTTKVGDDDYNKRVFTQDYITTLEMFVKSDIGLKNAYNVMPDLLAPRMEIGVLLLPKWDVITPTNVEMY